MSTFELDLRNTEVAFADKSTPQLKRRYWLFRCLNSETLNSIGTKLAELSLKIHLPVKWAIKATVFRHFCGGETIEECENTVVSLGSSKIGAILDYSVEGLCEEEDFGKTKEEIIRTIERAKTDDRIPFAVFKVTESRHLERSRKCQAGLS
jgi:proline dehydrogenase